MLENARLPSFHIKRLIDRSTNKRRQGKTAEKDGSASPPTSKKPIIAQHELKKYWENYLSSELASKDSFGRVSKGLLPM